MGVIRNGVVYYYKTEVSGSDIKSWQQRYIRMKKFKMRKRREQRRVFVFCDPNLLKKCPIIYLVLDDAQNMSQQTQPHR